MMQVLSVVKAGQITSSGTTVVTFSDVPARLIVFQAATTNTGLVTITEPSGSAGFTLSAGESTPTFWCDNLSKFAYITATSGDKINYIVNR